MRSARNSQASEASIAVDLAPTFLSATPPSIQEIPYNCQSQSYASSFQTNATSILDDERLSLLKQAVQNVQYYTPQIEVVRTVFDDFTDFIRQGNMIDLAVGLILGKAFTDILNSFVVDILTPILSLFSERNLANYFFVARCPRTLPHCTHTSTWETAQQAREAGAITINWGIFTQNIMNFMTYSLFLYIAIKKVVELLFKRTVMTQKQCPYCREFVKGAAIKCKSCTSAIV